MEEEDEEFNDMEAFSSGLDKKVQKREEPVRISEIMKQINQVSSKLQNIQVRGGGNRQQEEVKPSINQDSHG